MGFGMGLVAKRTVDCPFDGFDFIATEHVPAVKEEKRLLGFIQTAEDIELGIVRMVVHDEDSVGGLDSIH